MARIQTKQGFFHRPTDDPNAYIFGASPILAEPLVPSRDWSPWLPDVEIQNLYGYDPLSCASFNTLACLEILIKRQYGLQRNYSDRYLAKISGTQEKGGNDPHYVAEVLRKAGDVEEREWPFLPPINTFEKYYAEPPSVLVGIAKEFLNEWSFKHDTVRGLDAMWEALQYSPLGCSVGINALDENGFWYKSGNGPDSHWTVLIGGEYGKYFLTFDSAEPVFKKLAWDKLNPMLVKRYAIFETPPNAAQLTIFVKILTAIRDWWLSYRGNQDAPLPPRPSPSTVPLPPKSPGLELYEVAFSFLDKEASPGDLADDEVGCAESLENVHHAAFDEYVASPIALSTTRLLRGLQSHPDFVEVTEPMTGDVAIFATEGSKVGHCGIVGKRTSPDGSVWFMSNDSKTGLWKANYTRLSWEAAAHKRGLTNRYFRRV